MINTGRVVIRQIVTRSRPDFEDASASLWHDHAHLRQGSVTIAPGDLVTVGDPLGKVGNSANTTEPHLHIHAIQPATGLGVPITFGGRFAVRNSPFRR